MLTITKTSCLLLLVSLIACGASSVTAPPIEGDDDQPPPDITPPATPESPVDTSVPQYLSFQVMNEVDGHYIDQMVSALGGRGDGKKTQLAFAIGPISLNHTDEQMRQFIRNAFKLAKDKKVAVAVHIDDSMFWDARTDLIADKNNVEWQDWAGTIYPHRVIGWAPVTLAPPICYESPTIRAEIRRIAKDVIGKELASQVQELESLGLRNLFAGVIAGWETRLDDDSQPRVQFGYCSLTHRGFSAAHPPADMDAELVSIVQRWIELWTSSLHDAGLPADAIYSHIALTEHVNDVHAPASAAFNASSRPGFSAYATAFPLLLGAAHDELASHDNPKWAVAEGADAMVGCKEQSSPISWEVYLGKLFNHGASFANIFGWAGGPLATVELDPDGVGACTNTEEALAAFKKFLAGETLDPSDSTVADSTCQPPQQGGGDPAVLQALLQQLQAALQAAVQQGKNVSTLVGELDALNALMQAGDIAGAIAKAQAILNAVAAL